MNTTSSMFWRTFLSAMMLGAPLAGCVDREMPMAPSRPSSALLAPDVLSEGELLGNIYEDSTRSSDAGYYYRIIPQDYSNLNTNRFTEYMWADTASNVVWQLNYTDPAGGGACGSLEQYYGTDTSHREQHRPGPGQDTSGVEKHCIRPGLYRIQLIHNDEVVSGKDFYLDYLGVARNGFGGALAITDSTRSVTEFVEPLHYNQADPWTDTYVNFDVSGGSFSETAALYGQNIRRDTLRTTFTNQSSLSGYDTDYFRFSAGGSSTSWNLSGTRGTYLARLFYDWNELDKRPTGYFDPRSEYDPPNAGGMMRVHSFGSHVTESRTATVALELMRPDEGADGSTNATRSVSITHLVSVPQLESTSSYRSADQYVRVGNSARGDNIRYRWQFESGEWTSETRDTLYDFAGYATMSPNPRQVRLAVRDTISGAADTSNAVSVSLTDGALTATGPSDVWDKTTKTYRSNAAAQWLERFSPSLAWDTLLTEYVDSVHRIWPAGNYTVDVRAEDRRSGVLRRGIQPVSVCSPGPCARFSAAGNGRSEPLEWSFFGGGPWLSWGTAATPHILRLYELMGTHDAATLFSSRQWFFSTSGTSGSVAGFELLFAQRRTDNSDVLAIDFTIAPPATISSYVFGMALDPDLGSDPADDQSGYDSKRGLLYVTDLEQAIGYLLVRNGSNALVSVNQYGTQRFAPASKFVNWRAQRTGGIQLQSGASDVQFVLSTGVDSGTAVYTLVVIRGTSVAAIQSRADQVKETLFSSR